MPRRGRGRGQRGAAEPAEKPRDVPANTPQGGDNQAVDGPSDNRGRSPSTQGPSKSVRTTSRNRSSSRKPESSKQAQKGKEPARDTPKATRPTLLRNVDLGGNAYNLLDNEMATELVKRPAFGKVGKAAEIHINTYPIIKFPTKMIYQYDVQIGSGDEKRGLIMATAESKTFKDAAKVGFIFDGNKIGWSLFNLTDELRFTVDLDKEKGQEPRKDRDNTVRVKISKATKVNLEAIAAYLRGEYKFDNEVLQAINFLDHLIRQTPQVAHINLKRSYFSNAPLREDVYDVGLGVQAHKGIYQSIRMMEHDNGTLAVNADVSNSCFWKTVKFSELAFNMSGTMNRDIFLGMSQKKADGKEPIVWNSFRRLAKCKFKVKHSNQNERTKSKIWTVERISSWNAKTYIFNVKNRETGVETPTSVYDYYRTKYNVRLEDWHLPLIQVSKGVGTLFPMEVCVMEPGQRYPYKLGDSQTSEMIKFAVSRPDKRKADIDKGLKMLGWKDDKYMKNYGLNISNEMLRAKCRILDPPEILYKTNSAKPGYSGRWDLRGKVFAKPNPIPLKSWAVVVISGGMAREKCTTDVVKAFLKNFILLYRGHGGNVANTDPPIINGVPDSAKAIEVAFSAAGNQVQLRPHFMLIILPNRNVDVYRRVKKNLDCRWGIVSQCCQSLQVMKNNGQYISNLLMKVNCKLGGTTCIVKDLVKTPPGEVPPMIIGADVSHGGQGTVVPSIAGLTMSMDASLSRYAAGVQTNGWRVEQIQTRSLQDTLTPLVQHWMENVSQGRVPKHVYYFRDGVSEGQYLAMLKAEVADIQRILEEKAGKPELVAKFTVIVCEKRHHIRFFPSKGVAADKNMNPVPGVIVDRDVTHPKEYDFYLNSHSAIQGTARPCHYIVLLDQMNVPVDALQTMIYRGCYGFQRATTPVSLFPAVYYAHLAAERGLAHEDKAEIEKWVARRFAKKNHGQFDTSEKDSLIEPPPLLLMQNTNQIRYTMWYC